MANKEVEPNSNGDSPCYLLFQTREGSFLFGPYKKQLAEYFQEEMGGTIIREELDVQGPKDIILPP